MPSLLFSHIAITCKDPLQVERFYTRHFGFKRARVYLPGPGQVVMIRSGDVYLELFPAGQESPVPRADKDGPQYPGTGDCLIIHVQFP